MRDTGAPLALQSPVMGHRDVLQGAQIVRGQALPVAAGEGCELGDGLSGTAFLVDWQADGSRDILYSLLPNMHHGGVYLYRERHATPRAVPLYDPPQPVAGVTGYHAMPLVTATGELHLLTYGNPTRDPDREPDPGWLKWYRNRGSRTAPRFAGPAERIPVDGKSLAEAFAEADLWNLNPYQAPNGVTHLVISCLYEYVLEYWPDARGVDLRDYPNMGSGRGYRADGTWMGRKPTTRVFLLRNTGTNEAPEFGPPELLAEYQSWDGRTDAALVDVDRDGALELLVRRDVDRLYALRLTTDVAAPAPRWPPPGQSPGTDRTAAAGDAPAGAAVRRGRELPRVYATGTAWELPCSPLRRGYFETSLCCCDLDGDGEEEILITGNPGVVIWLDYQDGAWRERPPLQRVSGAARVETLAVPCLADLDGSGAPDLIVGDSSGYLWRFANRAAEPTAFDFAAGERLHAGGAEIHHLAGASGSIQGPNEARWGYLNPLVVDWDGDGLADVITNDIHGRYLWYRNVGSREEPHFARAAPLHCDDAPLTGAWRSRPAAWGDGALLLLNSDGFLQLFRRSGSDPARLQPGAWLRYADGNLVRGCGPGGLWGRTAYCGCDWDLDGTRDLVAGSARNNSPVINGHFPGIATPFWLRNISSDAEPVFERPRLITTKNGTPINLVSHKCAPWCADLDGDGAPDLICGSEDGKVYAWRRADLRWDWDPATRFAVEPVITTSGYGVTIAVDPKRGTPPAAAP